MITLSLLALPSPYLMKLIFDKALAAKNIRLLNIIIILLLTIQLVRFLFSFLTDYHFSVFSQEIMVKVKEDLFYRILRLPLSFFDKNHTGYIRSRIEEVDGLSVFFSNVSTRILVGFLEFIFCLAIIFYLNWKLTLISLGVLPFYYFATKICSQIIRKLASETYEKGAAISGQIQDSLSGAEVIKCFGAERKETENIHNYLDELRCLGLKRNVISAFSWNSFAGYPAACRGEECMPCRGGYKGDRKGPLIRIGPCSAL